MDIIPEGWEQLAAPIALLSYLDKLWQGGNQRLFLEHPQCVLLRCKFAMLTENTGVSNVL